MTEHDHNFYPGDLATPAEIRKLAEEYRLAADNLRLTFRSGAPISRAPYRLVAIHAIELYLNACLVSAGNSKSAVRGLRHDFAKRADLAINAHLKLRKRTEQHLRSISERREYLATRYDPASKQMSEINRLDATLVEIAQKVSALLDAESKAQNKPAATPLANRPPLR